MSDESGLSKIIDSIGRLKLGERATALLTGLAILVAGRNVHPIVRCFRLIALVGAGFGYFFG